MKTVADLRFKIIREKSAEYERCYKFWKASWEATFQELQASDHLPLPSDGFVYRTKNCFFDGAEPVGIYLTEMIESDNVWKDHSYFKMYSPEVQSRLWESYDRLSALSYIAIAEPWRKSQTDVPLLDLVFGLCVREFLESDADAFVSCVRKNRKVDSAFSCYGGESLGRGHAFNVEVEYMVLERNAVRAHPNRMLQTVIDRLWTKSRGVHHENATGKRYPAHASDLPRHALGE